tara:strand:+ start:1427 stop:2737 length:1311 start_codon:yes stop_codon:yes gene_type:complete
MKISNTIKKVLFSFTFVCLVVFSLIAGAIIEKFNLFPITAQLSLFLENSGLSALRSKVKDSVTGADQIQKKYISSNYYDLVLKKYTRPTHEDYGGIDILNKKLFYVDNNGYGWVLKNENFEKVISKPLDLNEESFLKAFGASASYSYGVKDLLVVKKNDRSGNEVFLSATNFNEDVGCYFLSIFVTEIDNDFKQIGDWKNIFNSSPCLKKHRNNTYAGTSAGGRLGHKDNFLYLSLGDFYFDGVNEQDITSISNSDYGKIIEISLDNLKARNFAVGLRNPQGMFIDHNGVFETEHAPQGGDELNYISFDQVNNNYGWPNSSFGVDYGKKKWPLDPSNNNHMTEGFIPPIMSWIPSIGISNLIRFYSNNGLSRWNEDLIITSLREKSIFRIKLNNMKPIMIEKIELGFRIRDLVQDENRIFIQEAGSKYIWELKESS